MRSTTLIFVLLSLLYFGATASAQDDPPTPAPEKVEPGTLQIYVVDEDDEPVFQASVYLTLTAEEQARKRAESKNGSYSIDSQPTDPDGFVELQIPAGETRELNVSAYKRKAKQELVEVEPMKPGESREITVQLRTKPDADAVLRLIDEDGQPLQGVQVFDSNMAGFGGLQRFPLKGNPAGVTDEDGRYPLRVRSWGSLVVAVQGVGLSPTLVEMSGFSAMPRSADKPVTMKPAAVFRGSLRSDSQPLYEGLKAVLETDGYHMMVKNDQNSFCSSDIQFTAAVGMDGRFLFDELPGGVPLMLKVVRGREVLLQETTPRILNAGEATDVALTLGVGSQVSGLVLETDGTPAAGIPIWLATKEGTWGKVFQSFKQPHARTVTDGEGRFAFERVNPGKWCVGLAPMDRRTQVEDSAKYPARFEAIDVGADSAAGSDQDTTGDLLPVELTIYRGLYLTGKAFSPDGEKAPAQTQISAHGSTFEHGKLDAAGEFKVGPLIPGDYTVEARAFSIGPEEGPSLAPSEKVKRTVKVGQAAEAIELRLRPGGSIKVWGVVATTGEQVDTSFSYSTDEESYTMSRGLKPEHDFRNLAPSAYSVILRSEDGRIGLGAFELEAGDALEEEITLEPGGSVEVHYEGLVPYGQVKLIQRGHTMARTSVRSGTSDVVSGFEGTAVVRVTGRMNTPEGEAIEIEREVEINAGETVKLEIKGQ